ncbi:hypothetical protein [Flavobacterium sp.]|nr:hypothetical protein [Flavobacterium sp.]
METSLEVKTTDEQIASEIIDSLENDTIAPMVEPKDSISKN